MAITARKRFHGLNDRLWWDWLVASHLAADQAADGGTGCGTAPGVGDQAAGNSADGGSTSLAPSDIWIPGAG